MTSIQASTMVSPGTKSRRFLALCMGLILAVQVMAVDLREGDLLFVCSEVENAITQVTDGVGGLPIDHVAIVHRIGGDEGLLYVIEAKKPAVCLTPIDTFLLENPHSIAGRVNAEVDIRKSVRRCLMMVGKPYDDLYLPGDSAIYCSELVQLNYVDYHGSLVFDPIPMSFHDTSGQVTGYWQAFYAGRGMTVPEGAPGSNPGEMSRRPQVTIITNGFYSNKREE